MTGASNASYQADHADGRHDDHHPLHISAVEGDWSSRTPYCFVGLTFRNKAEATFNGYSEECSYQGICDYGERDGQSMTYIPTTGGKGKSELLSLLGFGVVGYDY